MIRIALIVLLGLLVFMHILILTKVIPYNLVWGSRLKNDREMVRFESISLLVSLVFVWLALESTSIIDGIIPDSWSVWILWALGGFFALNTIGNLASKNKIERYVFGALTVVLAGCFFYLAYNH
jgi:hypothetical protein